MLRPIRWSNELWLLGGVALIGWLFFASRHWATEFIVLLLGAYCFWHVYHVIRLLRWLSLPDRHEPEHLPGLWGAIYARFYEMRKQERRRRRRQLVVLGEFRDSAHALEDAVVSLGIQGEILWFNRRATSLLGFKSPRDRGQRIGNLLRHPSFIALEKGLHHDPIELASPVQSSQMLSLSVIAYRNGRRLLIARDVTRLHKLEQMRQDFVANVSHELRTPITVLSGYLESLEEAGDKLGRYQRPVAQMQQQAARMRSIVDDLLFLSRLDNERLRAPAQRIAVASLLRQFADDARVLSGDEEHHISLDADAQLEILGMPKELHSAFGNLISNAVRYTPAGGQIQLRWQAVAQGGALFSVEDNGPGIAAHHLPRLTERFYRVDEGRSRDAGGTGLGLAIVKHVMERHGGRLLIRSRPGVGSVFSCEFPASSVFRLQPGRDLS